MKVVHRENPTAGAKNPTVKRVYQKKAPKKTTKKKAEAKEEKEEAEA